ncbi:alpha/beta hydrolase [Sphingomonas abietis]|uniref:Alpha/beta hydrolase n=1 Tax=Sphingomonas abietis TaxID=3012344 RepID=A0ABY7NLB5_9SPHN|nr:alpha/beta hydrolase [Sphingomonas abietis]WBO21367.1 alpha/beta hydrolase [Sphingomonas abietis]
MDRQATQILEALAQRAPERPKDADDARWLADFRYQTALLHDCGGPPQPLHAISHLMLADGPEPLAVRLYRPAAGRLPLLLHMHGGGAIAGSVDGHDPCLRALAHRTGWIVAAPLYRRAPEHRFPAQLDDGWRALLGVAGRADELGVDAARIVVSGDSIGGTFATALAVRSRDQGGPALAGQLLLYPNTDLRRGAAYPSRQSEDGNIIALDDLERQIDLHLACEADRSLPAASPLLMPDLHGLPRTLLVTCGADPLRDEGEAYGERLEEAGVDLRHHRFEGMIHGFLQMGGHIGTSTHLLDLIATWLG